MEEMMTGFVSFLMAKVVVFELEPTFPNLYFSQIACIKVKSSPTYRPTFDLKQSDSCYRPIFDDLTA